MYCVFQLQFLFTIHCRESDRSGGRIRRRAYTPSVSSRSSSRRFSVILFTITDDDFSASFYGRYKSVRDSERTGRFEIIPASLDEFVTRAPKWRAFRRPCVLRAAKPEPGVGVVSPSPLLLQSLSRSSSLAPLSRRRPSRMRATFGRGTPRKNWKSRANTREHARRRYVIIAANPVVPSPDRDCPYTADRVSARRSAGPGDAIAIRERQSHPRRFKNVATFPGCAATRYGRGAPPWINYARGRLGKKSKHTTLATLQINRHPNCRPPRRRHRSLTSDSGA